MVEPEVDSWLREDHVHAFLPTQYPHGHALKLDKLDRWQTSLLKGSSFALGVIDKS